VQKASWKRKSQQQTLVYEQKAQQAKLEQAQTNEENPRRPGVLHSAGQQQLSEMRANESRLRGRIASAKPPPKPAPIVKLAKRRPCAIASRKPRKGTTYKPTESERSLMSVPAAGLAARSGVLAGSRLLHRYGEQLQGELRWKGMVIAASEGTEVKAIADGRVSRRLAAGLWSGGR
jgi:septal ring factor EnvC (AmiA/AmiB activator)